jgi:outer membrane protein TolC
VRGPGRLPHRGAVLALVAALILPSPWAFAAGETASADPAGEPRTITLREAVEKALGASPLMRGAAFDREKAGFGLRLAESMRWLSETKVTLSGGLVPGARGTVVDSPDSSDKYDDFGPWYKAELKLVQPLMTFGRLDSLAAAARQGIRLEEARGQVVRNTVGFETIRAWWALKAALRGDEMAADLRRNFDKLLSEVEERLDREDAEVDDTDVLEIRSSTYGVDRSVLDAGELGDVSSWTLAVLIGEKPTARFVPAGEFAPVYAPDEAVEERAVLRAVAVNREVAVLEAAAGALQARIDLTRSSRNPVLYLAGGVSYGRAGNRTEQDNPFVDDKFNYARIGAEVGLAWDPNVFRPTLEMKGQEAELASLREKIRALRDKVSVETRRVFREVARNAALLESARRSRKAADTWVRVSGDNWEMGLGEVKRLIDAYSAYYQLSKDEIEREFEYGVALARLALAVGDINLYLKWVNDGKILIE